MSEFAKGLVEASKSWASAYIQFSTGAGREEFTCYAFVEDDDDVVFYQHVLSNIPNIRYVGCGGKSGVLKLFEKMQHDTMDIGHLFFVDRDSELEPFKYNDEVLRTAFYSWENHVCQPSIVRWILQRRLSPNLGVSQAKLVEQKWIESVRDFSEAFACHSALLKMASKLNLSFDMHKVSLVRETTLSEGIVKPSVSTLSWFDEKVRFAESCGGNLEDIESWVTFYKQSDAFTFSQGKALFSILKKFVPAVAAHIGCSFLGEHSSPKHLLALTRWDDKSTNYIRQYAEQRLAS